jgi:flagellin
MAMLGIDVGAENLQAAESRIRDADMASEMVDYTKNAILIQSGTAMLAQANAKNQTVLQLLG